MGARQALNNTAARSDAIVVTVIGDGSYMFGMPSASFWISTHYNLPFLAIILNNGGTLHLGK
jgi:acetolactate synthase I/II/III large subunit